MKVIAAETMQELDLKAITAFGIPGLTLMENAGRCCTDEIIAKFGQSKEKRVVVFAGKGNNGGDGYVIARMLAEKGWNVNVFVLGERGQINGDAAFNLQHLDPAFVIFCPAEEQLPTLLREKILNSDVIVDALLGTGLNNNVSGNYCEVIELINASAKPVVAVDIPSGVHGTSGKIMGDAVQARITVTFACAKLGQVLFPGAGQIGRLVTADIGIPNELLDNAPGYDFLDAATVCPLLLRRDRQAHKGHFGHCLIIAGSTGKTGAAALSANSAVRSGSGLVTLAVPASLNQILEVKTTEAMTFPLPDSDLGYLGDSALPVIRKLLIGKDTLAIGPGLGSHPATSSLVRALIESADVPMVIDADGLNALAEDIGVLKRKRSSAVVLTPHPGEMARMLGVSVSELEDRRIPAAQEFARDFDVYLILKGARTIIAAPTGEIAINGSGNPGMATGGMGDVLTGIIASLLGQGYHAWDACRLGVFLHGYAADLVAKNKGEIGICATDVQEMLPYASNRLYTTLASQ